MNARAFVAELAGHVAAECCECEAHAPCLPCRARAHVDEIERRLQRELASARQDFACTSAGARRRRCT